MKLCLRRQKPSMKLLALAWIAGVLVITWNSHMYFVLPQRCPDSSRAHPPPYPKDRGLSSPVVKRRHNSQYKSKTLLLLRSFRFGMVVTTIIIKIIIIDFFLPYHPVTDQSKTSNGTEARNFICWMHGILSQPCFHYWDSIKQSKANAVPP
jgi:hypothetical protein